MVRNVTRTGNVEHEVYIGLVMQYHYVGLDKLTILLVAQTMSPLTTQTTLMIH